MWYLQVNQILTLQASWKTRPQFREVFVFSGLLFLLAIISWLSNREAEWSLGRARVSEAALKQERDSLETKVEQRTAELRQLQVKRLTELHRRAESGKLAGGYLHDLVSPLTAITLTLDKLEPEAELVGYVGQAVQASHRMSGFITALEHGQTDEAANVAFSLNETVDQVVVLLGYQARKAGVSVKVDASQDVTLVGNPSHFHQILRNLVCNSIEAYDGSTPKERLVTIQLRQHSHLVTIAVSDNGRGIDPDTLAHLFDGSGEELGLAITKNLVDTLGGSIGLESSGDGTTVTIKIPCENDVDILPTGR